MNKRAREELFGIVDLAIWVSKALKLLVKNSMVNGLDCDYSQELDFCESCTEGKSHHSPFQSSTSKRAVQVLELVHSNVCRKIGDRSLSGGEYFVTFIDDHTRYAWIYILKRKDEVFQRFCEWKALVEKTSGRKIKTFRTDNGGEYTSTEFTSYLTRKVSDMNEHYLIRLNKMVSQRGLTVP